MVIRLPPRLNRAATLPALLLLVLRLAVLACATSGGITGEDAVQAQALGGVAICHADAGLALQGAGAWPRPLALPEFSLVCPGRDLLTTDDLRGRVLHVVAGQRGALPRIAGALPVVLTRGETGRHSVLCASSDPAAWDALAAVTGQHPDGLAGSGVLVDANGWMRAFKAGPDAAAWDDPGALAAAVEAIAATPITAAAGKAHHRH